MAVKQVRVSDLSGQQAGDCRVTRVIHGHDGTRNVNLTVFQLLDSSPTRFLQRTRQSPPQTPSELDDTVRLAPSPVQLMRFCDASGLERVAL